MRILVVAATASEIAPLVDTIRPEPTDKRASRGLFHGHEIEFLIAGVGMVATAVHVASSLARARFALALNLGVCGAFDPVLALGSVVHVTSDRLSELGAEDGDAFLSIHDLGLLAPDEPPFLRGAIVNQAPPHNGALERLPSVRGITVNTVHGRDATIADVVRRFAPQVESMEGAAFMFACAVHDVPYAQVRAISNVVERRNRAAWQIGPAVRALNAAALQILESA
jgi:futalosine hydrolase